MQFNLTAQQLSWILSGLLMLGSLLGFSVYFLITAIRVRREIKNRHVGIFTEKNYAITNEAMAVHAHKGGDFAVDTHGDSYWIHPARSGTIYWPPDVPRLLQQSIKVSFYNRGDPAPTPLRGRIKDARADNLMTSAMVGIAVDENTLKGAFHKTEADLAGKRLTNLLTIAMVGAIVVIIVSAALQYNQSKNTIERVEDTNAAINTLQEAMGIPITLPK